MARKPCIFLLLILLVISVQACNPVCIPRSAPVPDAAQWVDLTLAGLTLEEKIGQLNLMLFSAEFLPDSGETWQTIEEDIRNNRVFGYHIVRADVFGVQHYITKMQQLAKVPLVFSGDFERGVGMRLADATDFPPQMAFGATHNPEFAYRLGKYTALEGRALGFTHNYAPVVDISNNPDNPIINTRSFGETPELVSEMALAFIRGSQDNGMACTVKHFPGHGDTKSDSHLGLAVVDVDKKRLESLELAPFRDAIRQGVESVLIAHVHVPACDPDTVKPATLSKNIIEGLLREELIFGGLVVTDAMGMGAISDRYTPGYAIIRALEAGCDIIINTDLEAAEFVRIIKDAMQRGEIREARIDASVRRILEFKARLGLHRNRLAGMANFDRQFGTPAIRRFAQEAADSAITLVKDENNLLPIVRQSGKTVLIDLHDENTDHAASIFQSGLNREVPNTTRYIFDQSDRQPAYEAALKNINDGSFVVIASFAKYRAYKGHIDLPAIQAEFINRISQKTDRIILISFGNPYILRQFPQVSTYLCAFGWQNVCQRAATKALLGKMDIHGRMPVSIPGLVHYGDGLRKKASIEPPAPIAKPSPTLRIGFPREVGIDGSRLADIRRLLTAGLADSAYPGAVFLAAKDGVIFAEYTFGRLDYNANSAPVRENTIYDLASLSKVIGTTSAAMLLYDDGLLQLDQPVAEIIPEFAQNGKEGVTIRHLLTHCSGLPAWSKLWKSAVTPQEIFGLICAMPLEYPTASKTVYSCLGMITMGKVIERLSEMPMDQLLQSRVFSPLNMTRTFYNPDASFYPEIAPTEYDAERGGIVHGKVHDENAYYLGGVSGNAGLFSCAPDLAIYAQMLLNGGIYDGKRIFREETIDLFTKRQDLVAGSDRTLGWGTPTKNSSGGQYFSEASIGHTGFTGTSIWIDKEKQLFGILLTNRVHPTRENQKLYEFRADIYDDLQKSVTDRPLQRNPNVGQ